ncbi:hypothetical protein [Bacteroides sp.]|uniref:hypothetical protein n=1 Tax=Bacteroides sp. TaxID=29523 RepID=UPI00257A0AAB|nr:hypothetical protein [Bacteroides sp.]
MVTNSFSWTYFAKTTTTYWQNIANKQATPCLSEGNGLPTNWQKLAGKQARNAMPLPDFLSSGISHQPPERRQHVGRTALRPGARFPLRRGTGRRGNIERKSLVSKQKYDICSKVNKAYAAFPIIFPIFAAIFTSQST